ncbi:hypothetical protein ILUMI_20727 [Ignelater luminosus]|uniref:Peroxin-19 n=1 Tax=Ignelater luminosus TaxID=2038154 RepID=A0A8K0G223_IGNLU|nr:hypothetical protein ILUMI_20727 [Ignelater luminosus]
MSDTKKTVEETPKKDEDKELADLLDSALEDFTKEAKKPTDETQKEKEDESSKETEQQSETLADVEWTEEFIRQAAEQFESNIANILKEAGGPELTPEQVQRSFQQMAEAASQVTSNTEEPAGDTDFAASISQALRGLSEGTENLQNPFSEQDLMSMFGQQEGDQNAFVPFMQGMMQSLLSKEVLYPSLKDILNKYPGWLEANGGSLSVEERNKYEQQQELMKQICEQLEKESENDTPEKKKIQFDIVLELMQKLQDYGQPPAELVGDLGPGVQFDSQGVPDLNQCSMM